VGDVARNLIIGFGSKYQSRDIQLLKSLLYADVLTLITLAVGVYVFVFLNVIAGFLVVLIGAFTYYSRKKLRNSVLALDSHDGVK
jgi:uncharacterized membrane protein